MGIQAAKLKNNFTAGIIQLIKEFEFPAKNIFENNYDYWFEIKILGLTVITIWILTLRCHGNFSEVNSFSKRQSQKVFTKWFTESKKVR